MTSIRKVGTMDTHTRYAMDANCDAVEESVPTNELIIPNGGIENSSIGDFRILDGASDVRMREA